MSYAKNMPTTAPSGTPSGNTLANTTVSNGITSTAIVDGLVTGPDNRVWFSQTNTAQVGASTAAGAVTQYALPTPSPSTCVEPQQIIVGPDKNLWAASYCGQVIQVTTAGRVTVVPLSSSATYSALAVGPDSNLWVADSTGGTLLDIATSGTLVRTITLPAGAQPTSLALGSDGNMWVADYGLMQIERVTVNGTVTAFASGIPLGQTVRGIASAPDKNLYFTAPAAPGGITDGVGRISTNGSITMLATLSSGAAPTYLVADASGNVWFRENSTGSNALGRIVTSNGGVSEYSLTGVTTPNVPDDGAGDVTGWLALGPNGYLWLGGEGVLYIVTPP